MNKEEYQEYLRSPRWQKKRAAVIAEAGNRCKLCGSRQNLQVHHNSYERIGGDEIRYDLVALCAPCHNHFHEGDRMPIPQPSEPTFKEQIQEAEENGDYELADQIREERDEFFRDR